MSDQMRQPSQEEIEAYYAQLREAPVGEVLMQCIGILASAAEAKLGRPDARAMIDSVAALVQIGGADLGGAQEQLKGAVSQLQMAQVQLEKQAGVQQGEGEDTQGGPAAQDGTASAAPGGAGPGPSAPPAGSPAPGAPAAGQPQQKATDRLWIPGR